MSEITRTAELEQLSAKVEQWRDKKTLIFLRYRSGTVAKTSLRDFFFN